MRIHYRYRKVTPAKYVLMEALALSGYSPTKIAAILGLSRNTVKYHLSPDYAAGCIDRAKLSNGRGGRHVSTAAYRKQYEKERYQADEEYRERKKKRCFRYWREHREALNTRRKRRYAQDPIYREKRKRKSRQWREQQRQIADDTHTEGD